MKIKDGLENIRDGQVVQRTQITHLQEECRDEFRQLQHLTRVSSGLVMEEIRAVANGHTPILQEIQENLVQILEKPSLETIDPDRLENLIVDIMARYRVQQQFKSSRNFSRKRATSNDLLAQDRRKKEKIYCNVRILGGSIKLSYVQTLVSDGSESFVLDGGFSMSFLAGWLPRSIEAMLKTSGEVGFNITAPDILVEYKCPARQCCEDGNLEGLKILLRKGQATARDIVRRTDTMDPDIYVYESLLHARYTPTLLAAMVLGATLTNVKVAVEAEKYDVCMFLIKHGADPYKKLYYEPNTGKEPRYADIRNLHTIEEEENLQ